MEIRVLTWNVFHAHDGHPDARPDWRSTLLGTAVDSGTHLHQNRTLVAAVGHLVARAAPMVALLQEVPSWAAEQIAAGAGMDAEWALTAPRIGPAGLRGRLGRMNPDLFRTHEGNANVILVRAPWRFVPGSARVVRLNPPTLVFQTARREAMDLRPTLDWLWEKRNLVTARIRHPSGAVIQVACCHCHSDPRTVGVEIPRAVGAALDAAGALPLILGGDLNATLACAAAVFDAAAACGVSRVPTDGKTQDIDHILVRGLVPVGKARRWQPHERDITVHWKGRPRLMRVSDHDPVEATLTSAL